MIHSYTKDLSGTGSVIAGVRDRSQRRHVHAQRRDRPAARWNETLFWNVYYVKGAFLNADAAFEVLQGMRTLELRMLAKCINTEILARFLDAHPAIRVHCNAVETNDNAPLCREQMFLGLPAPLFTIDMEGVPREAFQRFFDNLSPTFGHMISLGQTNTIVSCPALTTHSELGPEQLAEAGISPTTIRFAVGHEDPHDLIEHFVSDGPTGDRSGGARLQRAVSLSRDDAEHLIRDCVPVGPRADIIDAQRRDTASARFTNMSLPWTIEPFSEPDAAADGRRRIPSSRRRSSRCDVGPAWSDRRRRRTRRRRLTTSAKR